MTTNPQRFFCLFIALFLFLGCKGEYRPPGLPKLMPCEITVIDVDGQPLSGAGVSLVAVAGDIPWASIGTTDQNGVAAIAVNNRYKGAPAGKFKVVLQKSRGFDITVGKPDVPSHVYVSMEDERIFFINPLYTKRDETPFELEVIEGQSAKATFTLAKKPKDK